MSCGLLWLPVAMRVIRAGPHYEEGVLPFTCEVRPGRPGTAPRCWAPGARCGWYSSGQAKLQGPFGLVQRHRPWDAWALFGSEPAIAASPWCLRPTASEVQPAHPAYGQSLAAGVRLHNIPGPFPPEEHMELSSPDNAPPPGGCGRGPPSP